MEDSPETQEALFESIAHQVKLIANANDSVCQWRAIDGNDSLMVRQYKHLKSELIVELDRMLKKIDVTLQVTGS